MTYITLSESSSASLNILDNAGFEIWQRGTTFSTPVTAYTADRWQIFRTNGSFVYTVSQESSIVDSGQYSLKINTTVGATPIGSVFVYAQQVIENYQAYAGKTVTFSARVWCNTSGCAYLQMSDGVTNSTSALHPGDSQWHTLTLTKTMSATPAAFTALIIASQGQTSTTYMDSAMLVIGSNPVSFVPMNLQEDLARCQRYYETGRFLSISPIENSSSGVYNNFYGLVTFRVSKRVPPTFTVSSQAVELAPKPSQGAVAPINDTANWPSVAGGATAYLDSIQYGVTRNTFQSTYDNTIVTFNWTASADL